MSSESDPIFSKCIRLLHSNAKDSEEQLRKMLEDAIRQRNGSSKSLSFLQKKESCAKKEGSTKCSSAERKDGRKEEAPSQPDKVCAVAYDKHGAKNSKSTKTSILIKSSHSSGSSPASPQSLIDDEPMTDRSLSPEDDDDDLALEILEEDLACVVCRGMEVGVRNQLVECLECHSLYHQECHQPPVTDDMNDPRSAWYCAGCSKALNKLPSKSSRSSPKPGNTNSSSSRDRETSASSKNHVLSEIAPKSTNMFKRTESKGGSSSLTEISSKGGPSSHTSSSKSSSSKSNLPKTFGGQPATSTVTATKPATNASKAVVPKINIISADKRLAIMKKKAAKLQEKRKISK